MTLFRYHIGSNTWTTLSGAQPYTMAWNVDPVLSPSDPTVAYLTGPISPGYVFVPDLLKYDVAADVWTGVASNVPGACQTRNQVIRSMPFHVKM